MIILKQKILKWEPQHKGKIGMKLALIKTINWYQRNYLNKLLNLKSKKILLNKNMTIEKNLLLNFESLPKKKQYPLSEPEINKDDKKIILDCLKTGWVSSNGIYLHKFKKFNKF